MKMRLIKRRALTVGSMTAVCLLPVFLSGQVQMPQYLGGKHVQMSGSAMLFGELYGIHGADRRRPPSTARIAVNPMFSIGKLMTLSADLVLSTEGSEMRQNMNILGLHPVWAWGRAHLGDYADQFAQLTLNGVNVKGGEVDLYPANFRFTLGGGRTKRAVEGYALEQSYAQYLLAGRIGYGNTKKNYVDIHFVKVKDDIGSLPETPQGWDYPIVNPDTLQAEEDTLWIDRTFTRVRTAPQENLVLGCVLHFSLPSRMHLSVEASASAYTKDLYAEAVPLDSVEMPGMVRDMMDMAFTPRRSSFGDYAVNSNLEMDFFGAKTQLGYRYIGPGYISLGTPSTLNDRREMTFGTSFKWGPHRIQVRMTRFTDNLLGQRETTNLRHQVRTGINSMFGRWRSVIQINGLFLANDTPSDSLAYDFKTWIITTQQGLVFGPDSWVRQVGLQYTFQQSKKEKWLQDTDATYHTVNLTGQFKQLWKIDANLSVGLSFRDPETGASFTSQVYALRLTNRALNNRLMTSLFSTSSLIRDTRMIQTGLTAGYRLTDKAQIHLNVSSNVFRGPRDFEELRSSLRLSHQF